MPKVIATVRRKPGMTHAEFTDYIVRVHGKLARDKPLGLRRYVQNHVYDGAFGARDQADHVGTFHRDSVTELYFDTPQDMASTFSDDYSRTVIAPDGANFAELSTNQTAITREALLAPPPPGTAEMTKIMHFLIAAGSGVAVAQEKWQQAHEGALAAAPDFAEAIEGLSRSDVVPAEPGKGVGAHFGGTVQPPLALTVSLWIADDKLAGFRAYEAALMNTGLFDPGHSFFLFTREIEILSAADARALAA